MLSAMDNMKNFLGHGTTIKHQLGKLKSRRTLADDGRLFGTGNRPPLIGKAAAAASFKSGESGNGTKSSLSWVPEFADVSADGTVGFTDGRWSFDGAPDAKRRRFHATGHYLTVWRKDASGNWKVAADMGTTDPAPDAK